jgi:hypothetical protein
VYGLIAVLAFWKTPSQPLSTCLLKNDNRLTAGTKYGTLYVLEEFMAVALRDNIKPISYIKANAAEMMKYVNERKNPIIITKTGRQKLFYMKIAIIFIMLFLFSCNRSNNSNIILIDENETENIMQIENIIEDIDITGLYVNKHMDEGLKIEVLKDGNYKFSRIILFENGEPVFSEIYTAYVTKNNNPVQKYLYYWHTGRYRDIPGSNGIIVYEIEIEDNYIHGRYFFPEEPGNPGGTLELYKR